LIEKSGGKYEEWYTKHSLLNNLTKTEIMIVTSKEEPEELQRSKVHDKG